jgi:hypothetical protein
LEPFSYPLVASHVFVDTPHNTRLFSRDQGFCGEIVDAVIEASLDEFGVHLYVKVKRQQGVRAVNINVP